MKRELYLKTGRILWILFVLTCFYDGVNAQEMPPRPVTLQLVNNLNFGTFSQGPAGGSVFVSPSGIRTSTGDIILLNYGNLAHPAIFQVDGNPGTIVHLLTGSAATLTGNQGGSLNMTYGESDPATPLILPLLTQGILQVYLGGTLTVGGPLTNPPGFYSGTFYVMFIQE